MSSIGFLTRSDVTKATNSRPTFKQEISIESYHRIGLKGARSMNPEARNPEMPPSGVRHPLVYILGEAPGEEEDDRGEPFVGRAGRVLREHLPRGWQDIVRINNCVRTRPPQNRLPTRAEIECFRPSLIRDIEKTKPKCILGVGFVPLTWVLGYDAPNITLCRGRKFPVRIGGHVCWFFPTFHPMYIGRIRESRELINDVPGREYENVFHADIEKCFAQAKSKEEPEVLDFEDGLYDDVVCLDGSKPWHIKRLRKFFNRIMEQNLFFSIDLETNCIRPYEEGSQILTASVTTHKYGTLSFALNHREAMWGPLAKEVKRRFGILLLSKAERVAHNAPFELEWLVYKHGKAVATAARWHCTVAQAYILDERRGTQKGAGTQNLDFCCQENLGSRIKHLSNLDKKHMEDEPLKKILPYGGLDTKFDLQLFEVQKKRIKEQGLEAIYQKQIERIPPFVFAQLGGLPIRVEAVQRLQAKLSGRAKRIAEKIRKDSVVKRYVKRFGSFNPLSVDNVVRLFRDLLGRQEGKRDKKYSTDEESLKSMSDVRVSGLILKLRSATKLKSTYVDPLDPSQKKTVVFPDGKLHCQMNPTWTSTGRSSLEGPSLQNYPIREHPWIRKVIGPSSPDVILSFDFGAIQARCIAMESGDKTLAKAFWTDYDIHMEWAEKIAKVCNESYREIGKGDMDHFRAMVKNKMVFPAFFDSSEASISRDLLLPERIGHELFEEFWDQFSGVKKFHKRVHNFYNEHLYVESLSGRRRRAPMSKSMIVNSPIQSDEAEIVCEAMKALWEEAMRSNRMWLFARLNVHDDLEFILPKNKLDEAVETIVPIMCAQPFKWMKAVPIVIEGAVGRDWYQVKKHKIGKFQTDKIEEQLADYREKHSC